MLTPEWFSAAHGATAKIAPEQVLSRFRSGSYCNYTIK
jgi:hypothetical protein